MFSFEPCNFCGLVKTCNGIDENKFCFDCMKIKKLITYSNNLVMQNRFAKYENRLKSVFIDTI